MAKYPSKGVSLWNDTMGTPRQSYSSLKRDLVIDVAVIGAGIVGLTLAYLLKRRGKNVAVFEKYTIGEGVSGFTTAKVTSQHGMIYTELAENFDIATARLYGEANEAAIQTIEDIIKKEHIECDWRREDNYVYTEKAEEIEQLKKEAKLAASLGLPAEFTTDTPLPFSVQAAVRFKNQGTFHILKYLQALARLVDGEGSYVFENTKAKRVKDGDPVIFKTKQGTVTANDVVFATNVPAALKDHAYYAALEYPTRSYLIAGRVSEPLVSTGMYINTGNPTNSFLPTKIEGQHWLLVGGYGHFVGVSGPASLRYKKLKEVGKKGGLTDITYRWSTWDYVSYDGLPLVGKLYKHSRHVYTATGFRKWGMTNATVSAVTLADLMTGHDNPCIKLLRPYRPSVIRSLPKGLIKGFGYKK